MDDRTNASAALTWIAFVRAAERGTQRIAAHRGRGVLAQRADVRLAHSLGALAQCRDFAVACAGVDNGARRERPAPK
jgi:hypothetical protein